MTAYPLTIYYDASCPLCRAEIDTLKQLDEHDRLRPIDCSAAGFTDSWTARANLSGTDLMRALHARDANGRWYIAVDAFVQLYRAVELGLIARLWAAPRLRPLWDFLYPRIVANRGWLGRLGLGAGLSWVIQRTAKRSIARRDRCRACDNRPA